MIGRPDLALIVPVYHCNGQLEGTLAALEDFISRAPVRCELILVDDRGTHPEASERLRRFGRRSGVRVLENDRNRGKGFSVTRGMLATDAHRRIFTDADLAYPLDEVWTILETLDRQADLAIACRVLPESQYVMSSGYLKYIYTRHLMSRTFNWLVRFALLPGVLDSQAGLKGFTGDAAKEIFSRVSIAGFGFDVEVLYLARLLGLRVQQVPVRFNYADEPSTVRFLRDARTMAADLARIRVRAWRGAYAVAAPMPPLVSAALQELAISQEHEALV